MEISNVSLYWGLQIPKPSTIFTCYNFFKAKSQLIYRIAFLNMKRLCLAILAILYLTTSMGATIHLHYCMGKLVECSLWNKNSSKCSKCGMEKKPESADNRCCRDEHKHLKIDKDQKLSENLIPLHETITEISFGLAGYSISQLLLFVSEFKKINSPPRSCNSSNNIFNCVFRI